MNQVRVYPPSNIYGSPLLGDNVKIGAYCDIGDAVIEDDVSIGAFAFIPGKVIIRKGAWIGPRVTFTHGFPPDTPADWKTSIVGEGAKIGAAVTILSGITIGARAIIGAGSVVTRNVPPGQTWCGVPARKIKDTSLG